MTRRVLRALAAAFVAAAGSSWPHRCLLSALPHRRGAPAPATALGLCAGIVTLAALGRHYRTPGLARARAHSGGRFR